MSRSLRTLHVRWVDGRPEKYCTHENHDPGDETEAEPDALYAFMHRSVSDKWVLPDGKYTTVEDHEDMIGKIVQGRFSIP